jgi:hypothetical protein
VIQGVALKTVVDLMTEEAVVTGGVADKVVTEEVAEDKARAVETVAVDRAEEDK